MAESRTARFKRVAEKRTRRLLREIELISNLSNRNNYAYVDEDVVKIFSAVDQAIIEAKASFVLRRSSNFRL